MTINIGDLITLKGLKNTEEKPLGIVMRIWAHNHAEVMWLNHDISKRFALRSTIDPKKLDVVNSSRD
jgi:hypothetical protein